MFEFNSARNVLGCRLLLCAVQYRFSYRSLNVTLSNLTSLLGHLRNNKTREFMSSERQREDVLGKAQRVHVFHFRGLKLGHLILKQRSQVIFRAIYTQLIFKQYRKQCLIIDIFTLHTPLDFFVKFLVPSVIWVFGALKFVWEFFNGN